MKDITASVVIRGELLERFDYWTHVRQELNAFCSEVMDLVEEERRNALTTPGDDS